MAFVHFILKLSFLCKEFQQQILATIKLYFSNLIVVLVALQVLNLGLYAQDFITMGRDKDGCEPNIINSVTEYLAEVVMNKPNAFPERKERPNQSEHESTYKFQPFKIYTSTVSQSLQFSAILNRKYAAFLVHRYNNHTTDITSPPPKFIS